MGASWADLPGQLQKQRILTPVSLQQPTSPCPLFVFENALLKLWVWGVWGLWSVVLLEWPCKENFLCSKLWNFGLFGLIVPQHMNLLNLVTVRETVWLDLHHLSLKSAELRTKTSSLAPDFSPSGKESTWVDPQPTVDTRIQGSSSLLHEMAVTLGHPHERVLHQWFHQQ